MRWLVFAVSVIILAACGLPDNPSPSGMRFYCEESVRERLKSPSTAKFSGQYETAIASLTDKARYQVRGYVDAQNSFGATIRSNYVCVVNTYTSADHWTYSVESVAVLGR